MSDRRHANFSATVATENKFVLEAMEIMPF